jgi:hypothetical protein
MNVAVHSAMSQVMSAATTHVILLVISLAVCHVVDVHSQYVVQALAVLAPVSAVAICQLQ